MSPTRLAWYPLRAKTRTAASRSSRRFCSGAFDRSGNPPECSSFRSVKPLAGLLVVDMTRYLPGPFASRELLRLGARVVRLEAPEGDPLRELAPAWHAALTGGLACYRIYATADGRHLTVAALEPRFFRRLCELLGRPELAGRQWEADQEPLAAELAEAIAAKPLATWLELFDG